MANFFRNPKDLGSWIRDKETLGDAFNELLKVIKISSKKPELISDDELDIKEACTAIYNEDDKNASRILYKILSRHNLTELKLEGKHNMEKEAQSKQRNDWMNGDRNKWNRAVDGFKKETPWRIDRDQMFDFTHYTTDALSFDENPNRVYSGEALWRMYVMDKFYREYKTAEGKWVGGYINDRFHVFPTAGTPANPDAPRDGGNQMQLGLDERTRKPKPHMYSTERRLEEARGKETYDLEFTTASTKFNSLVKTASTTPVGRHEDRVYNMMFDFLDMKEAGVKYENILGLISDHYDAEITGVAQIGKFADTMVQKHHQIAYEFDLGKTVTAQGVKTFKTVTDMQAQTIDPASNSPVPVNLLQGTVLVEVSPNTYEISSGEGRGRKVQIESVTAQSLQTLDNVDGDIQDAADELGLNDVADPIVTDPVVEENSVDEGLDAFEVNEVQ